MSPNVTVVKRGEQEEQGLMKRKWKSLFLGLRPETGLECVLSLLIYRGWEQDGQGGRLEIKARGSGTVASDTPVPPLLARSTQIMTNFRKYLQENFLFHMSFL